MLTKLYHKKWLETEESNTRLPVYEAGQLTRAISPIWELVFDYPEPHRTIPLAILRVANWSGCEILTAWSSYSISGTQGLHNIPFRAYGQTPRHRLSGYEHILGECIFIIPQTPTTSTWGLSSLS